MPRYTSEDDRRRLVPLAIVAVLTALIDDERERDYPVASLRTMRRQLCLMYSLEDPGSPANASAVAQEVAEADGDAQTDDI